MPPSREGVRVLALVIAALTALVLGFIGLWAKVHAHMPPRYGPGFADLAYYDLQLFVMSSPPVDGGGPYTLPLQVARFLAPVTAVLALLETIMLAAGRHVQGWLAAHSRGHTVVGGDIVETLRLAEAITSLGDRKVILITSQRLSGTSLPARVLQVVGDLKELRTLRAAGIATAGAVYLCAGESALNARAALNIRRMTRDRSKPVFVYAEVADPVLCVELRARHVGTAADGSFRLDFFSLFDIAARILLDRKEDERPEIAARLVVLVGFGQFARAFLRELARRCGAGTVDTTVVGDGGDAARDFLEARRWLAERINLSTSSKVPTQTDGGKFVDIYVCDAPGDSLLSLALSLTHTSRPGAFAVTACLPEAGGFAEMLEIDPSLVGGSAARLSIFGIVDEACRPEMIEVNSRLIMARAIHEAYRVDTRGHGESELTNSALVPWSELPDDLKESNYAQVDGIGRKLATLGMVTVPLTDSTEFEFTAEEVEILARLEHWRWLKERAARGYRFGHAREGENHPDMVDWDLLSEYAKEKDRAAVRRLPIVLERAGMQIMRVAPVTAEAGGARPHEMDG